jgi:hypothetical protein
MISCDLGTTHWLYHYIYASPLLHRPAAASTSGRKRLRSQSCVCRFLEPHCLSNDKRWPEWEQGNLATAEDVRDSQGRQSLQHTHPGG